MVFGTPSAFTRTFESLEVVLESSGGLVTMLGA